MKCRSFPFIACTMTFFGLMGCANKGKVSDWCPITSAEEKDKGHTAEIRNTLLFEESGGTLFAKILKCGQKEYYIGDLAGSSSEGSLAKYPDINLLKWSGRLTCLNVKLTYPDNAPETTKVLLALCGAMEDGSSNGPKRSEMSTQTRPDLEGA